MAFVSADTSKVAANGNHSPPFQVQFETTKLSRRLFFAWFLLLAQSPRIAREFEEPHAFIKGGLIGGPMPLDLA